MDDEFLQQALPKEATTITTPLPEITTFIALQLRVARLEQEKSEVKKTDHSANVLASIRSQVPTRLSIIEEILYAAWTVVLSRIKNIWNKSPKEIIKKPKRKHKMKMPWICEVADKDEGNDLNYGGGTYNAHIPRAWGLGSVSEDGQEIEAKIHQATENCEIRRITRSECTKDDHAFYLIVSYKVGKVRFTIPFDPHNRRESYPGTIPIVSVEVLRYDMERVKVRNKEKCRMRWSSTGNKTSSRFLVHDVRAFLNHEDQARSGQILALRICVYNLESLQMMQKALCIINYAANVAFVYENQQSVTNDLDEFNLEEMDLKWQVAMISIRMKNFYKKTGRKLQFDAKEPVGFDKTKVECYNCHKTCHFARECRTKGNQDSRRRDAWNSGNKDGRRSGKQEDSKALVTIDGEGVDWTSHSEEEEDYALMACNSSGSDTEVTSCSNECKESYAKLKKLYDAQREQLSDASIEIKAYTQDLKKVEEQLVAHQQGQLWLGYGDHRYDGILSYENEVLQSVFLNKESELEKQPLYDRFVTAGGMHVVPPPMIGNYMPSGPDVEIDYSQFTYGPNQSQPSESETQTSDFDTCESDCSVETHESLPEPTVNEPKVVNQPKVRSDAPIIEEYESDNEDEHVPQPTKEQEQPSFASTNKQVKTPRETVKNQFTHSKNPTVDKKGLGYGFTARACFVCGSLSHLIRDCDFHEKRMAKQAELNNSMRMKSSQREIRPIWNNVQRVNHKNQFVPTAVLTRTGKIPVNTARASGTNNVSTARHDFNRQAVPTNAAMKVNTVKPIVNRVRPANVFYKTHSPFSRSFINTTATYELMLTCKPNHHIKPTIHILGRRTPPIPHTSLTHLKVYQLKLIFRPGPIQFTELINLKLMIREMISPTIYDSKQTQYSCKKPYAVTYCP
ncbi:putative ribonuclease H-like domain-containing protein [Tanacetum coccineum]